MAKLHHRHSKVCDESLQKHDLTLDLQGIEKGRGSRVYRVGSILSRKRWQRRPSRSVAAVDGELSERHRKEPGGRQEESPISSPTREHTSIFGVRQCVGDHIRDSIGTMVVKSVLSQESSREVGWLTFHS